MTPNVFFKTKCYQTVVSSTLLVYEIVIFTSVSRSSFALCLVRIFTMSICPFIQATCKGVCPFYKKHTYYSHTLKHHSEQYLESPQVLARIARFESNVLKTVVSTDM